MPRCPKSNSKYSIETIRNIKFLLNNGFSIRECAKKMNIPKSVIARMKNMDFNAKEVASRKNSSPKSRRKLSKKQESITTGWIIYRCILKQSTTTIKLKKFIQKAFYISVSPSWITKFMSRNHLSLQNPSTAKGAELMEVKREEGINCLNELRSLKKDPGQIAVVDKTKFYNDSHRVKHIAIKGAGRPRKRKSSRGSVLCMYSFLVGDGTLGPLYLESTVKKHTLCNLNSEYGYIRYLSRNQKKRGETGFLLFLETCVRDGYLNAGDVLLTDNESSLKTKKVQGYLKKHKIILINFPSYMNHLMNPCDNYFHASMKRRYWSSIDCIEKLGIQEKVKKIRDAYYSEKESSIINYFNNCGLIGERKPAESIQKLLSEGLFPVKKYENLHFKQLNNYVKWFTNNEIINFSDFIGSDHFVAPK